MLLTCQGAPSLMRWRGMPLMKNVFDFAIYPALIAELRPRTIFEIGSGLGASAVWFADNLSLCGIDGRVHSVDLVKVGSETSGGQFPSGRLLGPESLFDAACCAKSRIRGLSSKTRTTMSARCWSTFHAFMQPGDYLVVEDSDVKRETLREFVGRHPGDYLVDTRFTDYFGRNATCAADSIFVRTPAQARARLTAPPGREPLSRSRRTG